MGRTLANKQALVAEMKDLLEASESAFVIDYKGLSVAQISDLRGRLRESGATCKISKNTLLKRAIADQDQWQELESLLTGTSAVLLTKEDIGSAVKAYKKFQKDTKKTELRGGVLEGKLLSQKDAEALADLPTKDELYAKIAVGINAVATKLALGIKEVPASIGRGIKAYAEKE
ncbi:ribosomal protein L10, putative [Synechococcus sp. PCC 7335]|uniref:50S ribosomal protein L10 n=1 Tax=Synechococcus sp. (strain ATCC 29403 / PCC 7335) TaxID=91464 RepID=UPI00017EB44B|nr:50S ribosomal protein L10 [Synechococcus sp. PCC 7335]EDX86724.1 ribosomal protein L10, putative [Synechococcus sp. PCC 7335]